jgi:hypothetical protein
VLIQPCNGWIEASGEIKMTNRVELKTFTRGEWLAMDRQTLKDQLEGLDERYPLVLHTEAGRSFSAVRRMKAEREIGLPVNLRSGFAVSVKTGKAASEMTDDGWEELYNSLCERLKGDYPDLYQTLFSPKK